MQIPTTDGHALRKEEEEEGEEEEREDVEEEDEECRTLLVGRRARAFVR